MPPRTKLPEETMRRRGFRVYLRVPRSSDSREFLTAVTASRELHGAWVHPPSTSARYAWFVRRYGSFTTGRAVVATHVALLVCRREDNAIVGVINIGDIVHGQFKSAYLGYYAFAPHSGSGYMSEGVELALALAFRTLRLHRIEANVQPTNLRSLKLATRAGFAREGYSRRYVRVAGRWRDHVRMALLVEEWRARKKPSRS